MEPTAHPHDPAAWARKVERFGDIVVVSYPKGEVVDVKDSKGRIVGSDYTLWSRGSAWSHLCAHQADGNGTRLPGRNNGDNPWRKAHTRTHWVWRYEPA